VACSFGSLDFIASRIGEATGLVCAVLAEFRENGESGKPPHPCRGRGGVRIVAEGGRPLDKDALAMCRPRWSAINRGFRLFRTAMR
jgi:hypothetical protein